MVEQTTQVILAVSGDKYPNGEHTPGKKNTLLVNYLNNNCITRIESVAGCVLPWRGEGFNAQILQKLGAIRVQRLRDAKAFSSGAIQGRQELHRF